MCTERIESQGVCPGAKARSEHEHAGVKPTSIEGPAHRKETALYAQVLEGRAVPERRHELERAIREKLIPALREEEGFCGALHLVDCHTDETMIVVCWETEEQAARPPGDCIPVAALSSEFRSRLSVWEVGARA
jgi:hypothetical protein